MALRDPVALVGVELDHTPSVPKPAALYERKSDIISTYEGWVLGDVHLDVLGWHDDSRPQHDESDDAADDSAGEPGALPEDLADAPERQSADDGTELEEHRERAQRGDALASSTRLTTIAINEG